MPGLLLLCPLALAELPPPSYREALMDRAERSADALLAQNQPQEALTLVREFRDQVGDHPRLAYEQGLILNLMGESRQAEALYREALKQDPTLAAAWYDLGGLLLLREEQDEAREAYEQAAALTEDHPQGWGATVQLALLAARAQDAEGLERWLRESMRRGLRFATLAESPEWTQILRDPTLGPILRRMVVVYGEEALLETWGR